MKLKELLPLFDESVDFKIGIINPKDNFDIVEIESTLTVEDTKILNRYKELKIDSIETPLTFSGYTDLVIYLTGDEKG